MTIIKIIFWILVAANLVGVYASIRIRKRMIKASNDWVALIDKANNLLDLTIAANLNTRCKYTVGRVTEIESPDYGCVAVIRRSNGCSLHDQYLKSYVKVFTDVLTSVKQKNFAKNLTSN